MCIACAYAFALQVYFKKYLIVKKLIIYLHQQTKNNERKKEF